MAHHKVVWSEGMFLLPHHFQQWDRGIRSNLDFRIKTVIAVNWGFASISLDEDALAKQAISCIEHNTHQAWHVFNATLQEGKKAAGAFHLTC